MENKEVLARATAILDELFALREEERAGAWSRHPETDAAVRAEVHSLLSAHGAAGEYLERNLFAARRPLPGTRIGPWRLKEEIGQGGMSIVYLAERTEDYEQRAAVKIIALPAVMTEAMARQIQTRFEAERQIVARLEHPNICKLFDGGLTSEGLPYLVLELVEGEDLFNYGQRQPLARRLSLVGDVARAVHHAHQRLVVHRDLKPSNVLVNAEGHVKLLDFGIGKLLDVGGDATSTLFRAATPDYASPEQLRGGEVTTATDIYSLGVLLRRVSGPGPPADVEAIIARATREEPSERYTSAADLAADLDRFAAGLPVEARRPSFGYAAAKLIRRHRAAFALAVVALATLIVATGLTFQKNREIERERQRSVTVAGFLRGLFQASDPEINQGNRLTTRQLLDEGAASLRTAPLDAGTRLELTATIASAYAGLGLYEKAAGLFDEIRRHPAASLRDRAVATAAWTGAVAQLGRFREAETAGEAAIALARTVRPPDAALEANALEQRCLALFQAARYGPAATACGEASLTAERAALPPLERARFLRSHGRTLKNTGDFAGAEKTLRESLALARAASGERHPTIAITLDELGGLFFRQGKFDAALTHFEQALALQQALYPEGHVSQARTLNNLANTLATLRQFARAETAYRKAHESYRRFLGEDSAELATSLSNLAVCQQGAGQLETAAATLEKVRTLHERATGRERLPYWNTVLKLANLRLEQNRATEAIRDAAEAVEHLDSMQPQPQIERGLARVILAAALIETGRGREALAPAESGRAVLEKALSPQHWMRSYAETAYAGALLAHGQAAAARAVVGPLYSEVAPTKGRSSWRAAWIYKLGRRAGLPDPGLGAPAARVR